VAAEAAVLLAKMCQDQQDLKVRQASRDHRESRDLKVNQD